MNGDILNNDFASLIDIAKKNLFEKTNQKMLEYNENKTEKLKHEVMECLIDREKLFTNDKDTIIKYLSINNDDFYTE